MSFSINPYILYLIKIPPPFLLYVFFYSPPPETFYVEIVVFWTGILCFRTAHTPFTFFLLSVFFLRGLVLVVESFIPPFLSLSASLKSGFWRRNGGPDC